MSIVKFEAAAKLTEGDVKAREAFEMFGAGFDLKKLDLSGADAARPFLTPMVWAIYSAIHAITMHGVVRWSVLKFGLGAKNLVDDEKVAKLIKAVLPGHAEFIDKFGPSSYFNVLASLDSQLMIELDNMLAGKEVDKASIEQAVDIVNKSHSLLSKDRTDAQSRDISGGLDGIVRGSTSASDFFSKG